MRSAARSARAGSSSCTRGTPKAAITASPMNFSTVPPSASISARMAAKKAPITSFSPSASSRSPSAVEPVMSANSTVTTLRSSTSRGRRERELRAAAVAEARLVGVLAPAALAASARRKPRRRSRARDSTSRLSPWVFVSSSSRISAMSRSRCCRSRANWASVFWRARTSSSWCSIIGVAVSRMRRRSLSLGSCSHSSRSFARASSASASATIYSSERPSRSRSRSTPCRCAMSASQYRRCAPLLRFRPDPRSPSSS